MRLWSHVAKHEKALQRLLGICRKVYILDTLPKRNCRTIFAVPEWLVAEFMERLGPTEQLLLDDNTKWPRLYEVDNIRDAIDMAQSRFIRFEECKDYFDRSSWHRAYREYQRERDIIRAAEKDKEPKGAIVGAQHRDLIRKSEAKMQRHRNNYIAYASIRPYEPTNRKAKK